MSENNEQEPAIFKFPELGIQCQGRNIERKVKWETFGDEPKPEGAIKQEIEVLELHTCEVLPGEGQGTLETNAATFEQFQTGRGDSYQLPLERARLQFPKLRTEIVVAQEEVDLDNIENPQDALQATRADLQRVNSRLKQITIQIEEDPENRKLYKQQTEFEERQSQLEGLYSQLIGEE